MDKIQEPDWGNIFSDLSQEAVFSSDRYHEVITRFSEPGLAAGRLSAIHTPGIQLVHIDIHTERKLVLVDPAPSESVSSSFIVDGDLESRFALNKDPVIHWQHTHGFQYTPDFQGEHIIHNRKLQAFSLFYDTAYFKSMAQSAATTYLDKVLDCMERRETLLVAPGKMLLQPRMAELLHALSHCSFQGFTKYLFIEAKLLELLALQIEQLNAVSTVKETWSRTDRERLKAVHDFIHHHYLEPLTLTDLCYRFQLNEFKLKKGYKHFFGSTVFGHIHALRMQVAQQFLASGQMNVSEVSFHIGYNNISSFSAAFKKHFGYLPGTIRLQRVGS